VAMFFSIVAFSESTTIGRRHRFAACPPVFGHSTRQRMRVSLASRARMRPNSRLERDSSQAPQVSEKISRLRLNVRTGQAV
jgi:hypothetical protein